MKNISPEICRQIAQARRDANISQSRLAADLGCKQPALSMFEAGDGTKLSDQIVKRLAERFGVSLESSKESEGVAASGFSGVKSCSCGEAGTGYCPNCHCPSNVPYVVDGRVFLRPSRKVASPVPAAKRCAACGEVLETCCPACGAPLNDGACCAVCGMPYVTPALPAGVDVHSWVLARREEIASLRSF